MAPRNPFARSNGAPSDEREVVVRTVPSMRSSGSRPRLVLKANKKAWNEARKAEAWEKLRKTVKARRKEEKARRKEEKLDKKLIALYAGMKDAKKV
ncbi:unnamed protein product [Bursaphelenchus xylophilus]|uniref:(pine wood nematode) hypothetical protein n=1 Tax=Bursaphelenchus xylophilus TaxID=6326 RepID=A0A1I7RN32_BURXY|nr:unnamed protein product [Bursaphelenchus xylophilus]CAG9087638.1 unnamed protein product [Bursaphelenchus xylophilus]